jgi:tRNA 2-thiouridine synthesizing protein A
MIGACPQRISAKISFMNINRELDTRGLKCPLPILRCKKALAELAPGEILKAYATDSGAVKDFQAFCRQTGHQLLSLEEISEQDNLGNPRIVHVFLIQKKTST